MREKLQTGLKRSPSCNTCPSDVLLQLFGFIYCGKITHNSIKGKVWGYCFIFLDLLSHLLIKAFGNYDVENMITAFLIARQAALEGPAVFMPYSKWFKVR